MEWIIKNPVFYWYLTLFLSEAVEASQCHFFQNWLMKHKSAILLKPQGTIIQENYLVFYPSEPFRILHFNMRHPVDSMRMKRLLSNQLNVTCYGIIWCQKEISNFMNLNSKFTLQTTHDLYIAVESNQAWNLKILKLVLGSNLSSAIGINYKSSAS